MMADSPQKPGRLSCALTRDLDATYAEELRKSLLDRLAEDLTRVTLDLHRVDHISGPGLGLLYALDARLGSVPSRLVLLGVCPSLLRLFTLLGLDRQFALTFRPASRGQS